MTALKLVEQMSFNYDLVAAPIAIQAREAAERIKLRLRRSAEDIIEIGRDLMDVQGKIGHGNFLPWIEAEFGMSQSAAYKFMNVARAYGDKVVTVTSLAPSALYELAAPKTPLEVREEIEAMIAAGEVVTKATVIELRAKLSGLEKAKALAEEEIEQTSAKVAELETSMNVAVSTEIEKAAKRIADGYTDEIARLKREIADLKKPKPVTIDNETGNVVSLHKPLTDEEAAAIDAEHDEYADADFAETASDVDRAMSAFGAVRSIAKANPSPKAIYQYISSHSRSTIEEYTAMIDQALSLFQSVKEMLDD